jgi:uncharacterized membrane protein YkoI
MMATYCNKVFRFLMMFRSIGFLMVLATLSTSSWGRYDLLMSLVTLDQATQQVIAQTRGKVLAAKTELENGQRVHVIKVLTLDGRVQYVKVDASSGRRMN